MFLVAIFFIPPGSHCHIFLPISLEAPGRQRRIRPKKWCYFPFQVRPPFSVCPASPPRGSLPFCQKPILPYGSAQGLVPEMLSRQITKGIGV